MLFVCMFGVIYHEIKDLNFKIVWVSLQKIKPNDKEKDYLITFFTGHPC